MGFNRIKALKRLSREQGKDFTKKGGPHESRRDKERGRPTTRDFMREYDEDHEEKDLTQPVPGEGYDEEDERLADDHTPYGER